MRAESDFVGTVVRLMRLTREGKLEWHRATSPSPGDGLVPAYTAEIGNLRFSLEDVRNRSTAFAYTGTSDVSGTVAVGVYSRKAPNYRLIISDLEKREEIVSPPLQVADDLAAVVRGYDQDKLEEINRRLDAELG